MEARTPVTALGEGSSNGSFSNADAESPIRRGKEAAASDPWVSSGPDGCLISLVRLSRFMTSNALAFRWGLDVTNRVKAKSVQF